jgi:hypothetical protein
MWLRVGVGSAARRSGAVGGEGVRLLAAFAFAVCERRAGKLTATPSVRSSEKTLGQAGSHNA